MKKIISLFFLIFFTCEFVLTQDCSSPIILSTQEEVNSFSTSYPNCINLGNDLKIEGENIIDLSGLSDIKSINGSLIINNTSLEDLSGLDSLTFIGGQSLSIVNNPQLENVSTLINAQCDISFLRIDDNPNLTTLAGLEGVSFSYLYIKNCTALTECQLESICQHFANFHSYYITNNGSGCNAREDIVVACNFPEDNNVSTSCYEDGFEDWELDTIPLDWQGSTSISWSDSINIVKVPALVEGEYAVSLRSNVPFAEGNLDTEIGYDLPCTADLIDIEFTYRCSGEGWCSINLIQEDAEIGQLDFRGTIWTSGTDGIQRTVILENIPVHPLYDFFRYIRFKASPVWTSVGSSGVSEFVIDNLIISSKEYVSSTQETSIKSLEVYPNPTSSDLNINCTQAYEEILIYNSLGQQIMSLDFVKRIDLSQLEKGIYFLVMRNNEREITRRVVKN